jgi:ADP-heptose:LPS heptosyltransferase
VSEQTAQPRSSVMDVSSPLQHDDPALASFAERTRSARRVLVVDLGFLGDGIHLIPALWDLRRHYEQAELHLASTPQGCEVVGLSGTIDRFWPVALRREQRSLAGQLRALRSLRQHDFDVALNLSASDRSVILMGLVGARHRLASRPGRWHAWYRWLVPHWIPQSDPGLPVFEQFRQSLTWAGFRPGPKRFDLQIPDAARAWADSHVPAGAVHMSVCSANPLKEWPVHHHAKLANQLLRVNPGLAIAVSASARPREQERLTALLELLPGSAVRRLPAGMSVAQLAAVLVRCRFHIGPDSGVTHVAMALGIPTFSIFRRRGTGWEGWIPRGPEHRVFLQRCSCARDHDAPCAVRGAAECLEALSPEIILEACHPHLD